MFNKLDLTFAGVKYVASLLLFILYVSQASAEISFTVEQTHGVVEEGQQVVVTVTFFADGDYTDFRNGPVYDENYYATYSCQSTLTFGPSDSDTADQGVDYKYLTSNNIKFYHEFRDPVSTARPSQRPVRQVQQIIYMIKDNDGPEPNEVFTPVISESGNCAVKFPNGLQVQPIAIKDTEKSVVTIGDVTVDEGAGIATVPVIIDPISSVETAVDIVTTTGTAGTTDYTTTLKTVTIPAGQTTVNVDIPVTNDAIDEPDETFSVNGTVTSGNTQNTDPSGTVTITDNDSASTVIIGDVTVDESAGIATVPVSIDPVSSVETVVDIVTTTGTAGTTDYTTTLKTVTIPAGQKTVNVVIPVTNDAIDEPDENFSVNGTVTSGNTQNTDPSGTVTITDNGSAPTVTIGDVTVDEGAGIVTVQVSIDPVSSVETVVDIVTTTGTAGTTDYTTISKIVTIPSGQKTVDVVIPLTDDAIAEPSETFTVNGNVTSGNTSNIDISATVMILDNDFDAPEISLSSSTKTIEEGKTIQVMISLPPVNNNAAQKLANRSNEGCEFSATWDYATGPGKATKDVDYTFVNTPSVITSPSEPIGIELKALTDTRIEGSEEIDIGVSLEGKGDCSTVQKTSERIILALIDANDISSQKPEPEDLLTDSCRVLGTRTVRTIDEQSFFDSNCVEGEDISRNFEPEEISAQTNAVLGGAQRQLRNVRSRLDKLQSSRGQQRGIDVSGANISLKGTTFSLGMLGSGAGDENDLLKNSRWSLFANGEYAFGKNNRGFDKEVATGDRNFDFNSKGLTIGADYRFPGEKLIAGAALGYKDFDADFTSQEGSTNTTGVNVSMYGTYLLSDKAYLDGIIGVGKDRIKSRRPVNNDGSGGIGDQTTFAIGKPDAQEYTFSVGGGYEFNKREWTFNPYGRLDYTKGTIDKYREISSHNSARTSMFEIDKQSIESLTSSIGLKASRVYSSSKGVFIPFASLEWKHEFKGRGPISGQSIFLQDNPDLGVFPDFAEDHGSDVDKNYYNIGAGVSAVFPKGRSAFINIESRLGDSTIKDNAVRAGYRWEF